MKKLLYLFIYLCPILLLITCKKEAIKVLSTVNTTAATNITSTTATSGGTITNDGGAPVTSRGVCWSLSQSPTTFDSKTSDGSGTGAFSSDLTSLAENTLYYVRAYATNSQGTAYGSQKQFTTANSGIIFNPNLTYGTLADIDGNVYHTIDIGTQKWMAENLKVTKFNNGTSISLVTNGSTWTLLTSPGYCWYDNDGATNKNTYGALYNWHAVNSGKICPTGWHVPTDEGWTTLTDYLGGWGVTGGKLKETGTSHWQSPNTGATNSSGFTALSGGYRSGNGDGSFYGKSTSGNWWSSTETIPSITEIVWIFRHISYNSNGVSMGNSYGKNSGHSIRCVSDETAQSPTLTTSELISTTETTAKIGGTITKDGGAPVTARGVCWSSSQNPKITDNKTINGIGNGSFTSAITGLVRGRKYYVRAYATNNHGTSYGEQMTINTNTEINDINGNSYPTVTIGAQTWMASNLKVTKYNDGTNIPLVTDNDAWRDLSNNKTSNPGYCWYDNDGATNKNTYGALYNWHAVNSGKICPTGWHVSTHQDWVTLTSFLGGENNAGYKLKETGFIHWKSPNTGATNEVGFNGLPGGSRYYTGGLFSALGEIGYWWSSTEYNSSNAWCWFMTYGGGAGRNPYIKNYGCSVRCVKD